MIPRCSVLSIPARWRRGCAAALALAVGFPLAAAPAPESPAALVRAYRESPSPADRAALQRYATAHPRDTNGALAHLALGVSSFEQRDWAGASTELRGLPQRLPKLADVVAYYLTAARLESGDTVVAPGELGPVRTCPVPSPFAALADVLEARALTAAGHGTDAVRLLRNRYTTLPQPEGDLALAGAYQAAKNLPQAAAYFQQVYYRYPFGEAATRAAAAILTLRDAMGAAYPQPPPELLLARAEKFFTARDYARARTEYRAVIPQLGEVELDQARIRAGAADLLAGNASAASQYLRALPVAAPDPAAERLYWVLECARHLGDEAGMSAALDRLAADYPRSPWRFKALMSAANRYLVANRPKDYVPLYTAAYENFPDEPAAALCHWKVVWNTYIERRHDARAALRGHVSTYPAHLSAAPSLYFLGRLAEQDGRFAEARAYYARLGERFAGYYYGLLARERLKTARLAAATPEPATISFLDSIDLPERPRGNGKPVAATTIRVERARLLRSAGLDDLAATELRFGAANSGQAILLGAELARGANPPFEKLRLMKSLKVDYLALPVEEAPAAFWEALFPFPWRADLVRNAQAQKLDPYTVAGLIRQESEFNPQALSRAHAYGLTQVMPGTGRQLARKAGLRRFQPAMLYQPAVNLKLGTLYMRSLLDAWDGRWEETLAAYNAGPARAREWVGWYRYQEPAEFIETIPFTETRDYVQAVLRNAAMYRRLYEDRPVQVAGETTEKAPVRTQKSAKTRQKRG